MQQHDEKERYHKAIYAAKALGVNRITVYRYIREGKIEAIKIGRNHYISEKAFFKFVSEHCMPPGFQDGLLVILRRLADCVRENELDTLLHRKSDISDRDVTD